MGLINCTGCTRMLWTQTKPIANADRLTWQYIFYFLFVRLFWGAGLGFFFCLLSFVHFPDIFLSLKSVEFRENLLEEAPMNIISRWEVWKLEAHVYGKPWMKSRHGGSVHLSPKKM